MALSQSYYEKLEQHIENEKHFSVWSHSSLTPLLFDQIIRWAVLLIFKQEYITITLFIVIQLAIIPILTLLFANSLNKKVKRKFEGKIKNISFISLPHKRAGIPLVIFIILSWFVIDNILFDLSLTNWFVKLLVQIVAFMVFSFYQFFITNQSYSTNISDIHFTPEGANSHYCCNIERFDKYNGSNVSGNNNKKEIETQDIDKNDLEIVEIDSEVASMYNRTEAYTLESVFLGALSFSGFLTIASSDKMQENLNAFDNLTGELASIFDSLLTLNFQEVVNKYDTITAQWSLFALISILCLICSMFFILVLASRIRFSNRIEKLNSLLKIAQLYNSKEEELHLLQQQKVKDLDDRLDYLKTKVESSLNDTRTILSKARPLFAFMSTFRNLGIFSFYLILITSGLFFSNSIALGIISVLLIAYLFKSILGLINSKVINEIIKKHKK